MGNRAQVPFPPHVVILNTSLSSEDFVAKLVRAGVPKESVVGSLAFKPALVPALTHHFLLFGIAFLTFVILLKLFKKIYPQ
jgi:ABC-type dipeptide/oligopeptide/nickel transport system permease component